MASGLQATWRFARRSVRPPSGIDQLVQRAQLKGQRINRKIARSQVRLDGVAILLDEIQIEVTAIR